MKIIEQKISKLKEKIAEKILFSRNPVILWSGGLDSTLILTVARSILPNVNILQFRSGMLPEQVKFSDSLIIKENLKVLVYQPFRRFVLPFGEKVALVEDYKVGNGFLPLVRDLVHNDKFCLLDVTKKPITESFTFPFDVALVGWLKDDTHEVFEGLGFSEEYQIDNRLFYSPVIDFTKKEIVEMAEFLEIPVSDFYKTGNERLDTGNYLACSRCLCAEEVFCPKLQKNIQGADWNPSAMLEAFRARSNI